MYDEKNYFLHFDLPIILKLKYVRTNKRELKQSECLNALLKKKHWCIIAEKGRKNIYLLVKNPQIWIQFRLSWLMTKFWHLQKYKTNVANCTQNPSNLFIFYSLDLIYHFYNSLITFSVILAFDTETAWGWFTVISDLCFCVNTLVFSQHVWNKWSKFCSSYTYTKSTDFVEKQRENLIELLELVKTSQDKKLKAFPYSGRQKRPLSHSTEEYGINQQSRQVLHLTAFICYSVYYSWVYQLA